MFTSVACTGPGPRLLRAELPAQGQPSARPRVQPSARPRAQPSAGTWACTAAGHNGAETYPSLGHLIGDHDRFNRRYRMETSRCDVFILIIRSYTYNHTIIHNTQTTVHTSTETYNLHPIKPFLVCMKIKTLVKVRYNDLMLKCDRFQV